MYIWNCILNYWSTMKISWLIFHVIMFPVTRTEIFSKPRFVGPLNNVTVVAGRQGVITCTVEHLGSYKVAFVRIDKQMILTIHTHVITRNPRIKLSHKDSWAWNLLIENVNESDRGCYMCQVNTDPMMSQTTHLQVLVPPDIVNYQTSTDMVVTEGANITLQCVATGFPLPKIIWRREDKQKIYFEDNLVDEKEGDTLNFPKVTRQDMGSYLCIASNGIPPTVTKRIDLRVPFPPMLLIPNQLVGESKGQDVVLECHSEGNPKPINYWTNDNGDMIVPGEKYLIGEKYDLVRFDKLYNTTMTLTIRSINAKDFGEYVCISKNSLGETHGQIKLYCKSNSTACNTGLPKFHKFIRLFISFMSGLITTYDNIHLH